MESLRPGTRKQAGGACAPREVPFYSLVAYPQPDRISWILKSSYNQLSRIDARNDSQVIFYDQVVPGGTLLGYLNADHWAVVVPFARTHSTIASVLVTHNAYPRERSWRRSCASSKRTWGSRSSQRNMYGSVLGVPVVLEQTASILCNR